jgi:hypothetical protein
VAFLGGTVLGRDFPVIGKPYKLGAVDLLSPEVGAEAEIHELPEGAFQGSVKSSEPDKTIPVVDPYPVKGIEGRHPFPYRRKGENLHRMPKKRRGNQGREGLKMGILNNRYGTKPLIHAFRLIPG